MTTTIVTSGVLRSQPGKKLITTVQTFGLKEIPLISKQVNVKVSTKNCLRQISYSFCPL